MSRIICSLRTKYYVKREVTWSPQFKKQPQWRAPNGNISTDAGPFARAEVPFAGFSLIEARDLNEVIELVSKTPCAQTGGSVEVWPIADNPAVKSRLCPTVEAFFVKGLPLARLTY